MPITLHCVTRTHYNEEFVCCTHPIMVCVICLLYLLKHLASKPAHYHGIFIVYFMPLNLRFWLVLKCFTYDSHWSLIQVFVVWTHPQQT